MLVKRTLKLSPLFLSTIISSQLAFADTFFYKNANYSQPLLSMGANEKIASMSSAVNDQISSLHTSDCLLVFRDSNFRGEWMRFPSISNLEHEFWNDAISSAISFEITVEYGRPPHCAFGVLRQHSISHYLNSGGKTFPLIPEHLITHLGSIGLNDQISSVIVPQGYCLKAWHNSPSESVVNNPTNLQNWKNSPDITFTGSGTDITDIDVPTQWNDKLSAVLLTKCW